MERFGISVGSQLLEAVRFAGVGILLGVWYDLFRLVRLLTAPSARRIFVQDILFFASSAAVTLLMALSVSSGRVRVFHLLALAAGFFCYYQTVGRLAYAVAKRLVRALSRWAWRARRAAGRGRARAQARVAAHRASKAGAEEENSSPGEQKNFQKPLETERGAML